MGKVWKLEKAAGEKKKRRPGAVWLRRGGSSRHGGKSARILRLGERPGAIAED